MSDKWKETTNPIVTYDNIRINTSGATELIDTSQTYGTLIFDLTRFNVDALNDNYTITFPTSQKLKNANSELVSLETKNGTIAKIWYGSGNFRRGNTASSAKNPSLYALEHIAGDTAVRQEASSNSKDLSEGMTALTSTKLTTLKLYHYGWCWTGLNQTSPYLITDAYPNGISLWQE